MIFLGQSFLCLKKLQHMLEYCNLLFDSNNPIQGCPNFKNDFIGYIYFINWDHNISTEANRGTHIRKTITYTACTSKFDRLALQSPNFSKIPDLYFATLGTHSFCYIHLLLLDLRSRLPSMSPQSISKSKSSIQKKAKQPFFVWSMKKLGESPRSCCENHRCKLWHCRDVLLMAANLISKQKTAKITELTMTMNVCLAQDVTDWQTQV